jgi:phosphatidylinositol-bisphosphatase
MHSKTTPVEQLSYQGHPGITMSDHRPVSADFVVSVCRTIHGSYLLRNSLLTPLLQCDILDLSEYEMTMKKLNRQVLYMEEEETPPKVSLKPTSIDFGTVGYLRSVTKSARGENTGKVSRKNPGCVFLLSIWFDPWEDPRYHARSGSCLWRRRS